jgi:hypothetical protein
MVKSFVREVRGIVHVVSGPCVQVIGLVVCVGTLSVRSRKQDLQVESKQLCML